MSRKRTGGRRGNGEGSIQKRRDGRWVARASLPGGVRRSFYGPTREAVADRLNDALRAVRDGLPMPPARLTFGRFVETWLDGIRPSLRARTAQRYAELLRCHAIPVLGGQRLGSITASTLRALYGARISAGLSPSTVGQLHRVLHHALRSAAAANEIPRNPAEFVKPPAVRRIEREVLSASQVAALLRVTAGERFAPVYLLAAHTGMRQGEVFGLRWAAVDLDHGVLSVRASLQWIRNGHGREWQLVEPKTHASARTVPLTPTVVEALRRHRRTQIEESLRLGPAWTDHGLVFTDEAGGPIIASNFTRNEFAKALRRAGLPRVTFHCLRHTAASLALAQGVPIPQVTRLLGHVSPAVTLSIYSHALPNLERQAADALERAISAG